MTGQPSLPQETLTLYRIVHAISSTLDLSARLQAMLESTTRELRLKAASLRLLSADGKTLEPVAAFGLSEAYLAKGPVEVAKSPVDQIALQGQTVRLLDVLHDVGFQYPTEAAREGIQSVLVVPLRLRGRVIGVLRAYSAEPHRFTDKEEPFLLAVADLGALAIDNAQRHAALFKITQAINSSLRLDAVLQAILETTTAEMRLMAATVRLLDARGQTLQLAASYGLSERYLKKGPVEVERSAIDKVVLQGQAVAILDVGQEPGFQYPAEAIQEGIRSVLAVPIRVKDRIIGVLRVYSSEPYRFVKEEIDFLTAVAHLGGIAIENARLHEALQTQNLELRQDMAEWYQFVTMG